MNFVTETQNLCCLLMKTWKQKVTYARKLLNAFPHKKWLESMFGLSAENTAQNRFCLSEDAAATMFVVQYLKRRFPIKTRSLPQRQETQLSPTNRTTHLCNMLWRGWPPKTRPSALPRRIWSFTSNGIKIERRTSTIGRAGVTHASHPKGLYYMIRVINFFTSVIELLGW